MSQQQKPVKSRLRFIHLRYANDEGLYDQNWAITIGYDCEPLLDGTPAFRIAIARCRPPDNFCRRVGRAICEGRINSKDYWHVGAPDIEVSHYEFLVDYVFEKLHMTGPVDECN